MYAAFGDYQAGVGKLIEQIRDWGFEGVEFPVGAASFDEIGLFLGAFASSLWQAFLLYVLYVALEPYVRRRWPDALVSWTRVLAGRFRDPLVGRDIEAVMVLPPAFAEFRADDAGAQRPQ